MPRDTVPEALAKFIARDRHIGYITDPTIKSKKEREERIRKVVAHSMAVALEWAVERVAVMAAGDNDDLATLCTAVGRTVSDLRNQAAALRSERP